MQEISFSNTEISFKSKSNEELKKAHRLFSLFKYQSLVKFGPKLADISLKLHLPVKGLIKSTIFNYFCGGESIEECENTIQRLGKFGIGTILDYSVEGEAKESVFDATCEETIKTIEKAENNPFIPFSVFKTTGIGRFALLAKIDAGTPLSPDEIAEFGRLKSRFEKICHTAYIKKVKILVDAEESWIQNIIDKLTHEMMEVYNKETAIVYNTLQMYRTDRLEFAKKALEKADAKNYFLGFKLVRGAYMEKERARAEKMGYPSPIQPTKSNSDEDFNKALIFCMEHRNRISICAGTHNEASTMLLIQLMKENMIQANDQRFYFSQLLGMSDHISYNLSQAGYNVAKYVPYGPVAAVMPYLSRRAQENSSVKGQMGRELKLISEEIKRRNSLQG